MPGIAPRREAFVSPQRLLPPEYPCARGEALGRPLEDAVILAGRTVHVMWLRCPVCETESRLYYRLSGDDG